MDLRLVLCCVLTVAAAPRDVDVPGYDVIVVGLGAAGASAAGALARGGKRVLALEAQGRVGGRVHTVEFGDGIVEEGAEWIHGIQGSRVYDAASYHNVTIKTQSEEMSSYRSDGGVIDQELINELVGFYSEIADNSSTKAEPVGVAITRRMKEYIAENHPTLLEDEDFVAGLMGFLHQATNSHDASDDWNEVSTLGGYRELNGTQMASWHRHGYRTFFDIILNTYNGGPGLPTLTIALNSEVTKITTQTHHPRVVVECRNGSIYRADHVIVTVSLGVLKARHATLFSPPLPEAKQSAIEQISFGVVDKIVLSFNQPWWPEKTSVIGFFWREEDRNSVLEEEYWTTKVFGASRPMGSSNTMTLWLSGEVAKQVENLPEDVVARQSVKLLQRFMGDTLNITVPAATGIIRSRWYANPYTLGSYSFDNVRAPATARDDLRAPIGPLHFAGEAANPTHYSTVHGASETGFMEAAAILNVRLSKE